MITLVLGGRRCGKSDIAQEILGSGGATYIATGVVDSPVMEARVARHSSVRPASWRIIEEPKELIRALSGVEGDVLIDDITGWIRNDVEGADVNALAFVLGARAGHTVLVSEDVSAARASGSAAEERFYDRLGEANQILSRVADRCLFVVASRAIELPRWHQSLGEVVPLPARPGYGSPPGRPMFDGLARAGGAEAAPDPHGEASV